MASSEHTSKAFAAVTVNAPHVITEIVRAHDHAGSVRLGHLFEAHRLCLDMAADIQAAIAIEQQRCGEAAVPLIAARLRAVVIEGGKKP